MTATASAPSPAATAPPRRPASALLIVFLLLPAAVHLGLMSWGFFQEEPKPFPFEDLDIWFLLAFGAYLAVAVAVATSRSIALRFVLVAYAALAALAVAEGVTRVLLPAAPEGLPHVPQRFTSTVGDHVPGLSGLTYTYTVNSLGVRGPEVRLDDRDFKVLCIGGSTTECVIVPDEKTWPWRLQDKLAERLGKQVFVGNAGKSGQYTLHHAYQIKEYKLVPQFDWVVVMCGINDAGRTRGQWNYDREADKVPEEALTPVFRFRFYYRRLALVRLLHRVALYWDSPRTVIQDEMADWLRVQRDKRQEAIKAGRLVNEMPQDELKDWCAQYRENLLAIVSACQERGVRLLFLTQATLYRKDLPADMQQLLFAVGDDGAPSLAYQEALFKAYNRTMRAVARETGVDCVDLDAHLPKDTSVFFDDCHFNLTGCERVADLVADFFVKKLGNK